MPKRRMIPLGAVILLAAAAAGFGALTTLDQAVARALAKDRGLMSQVLNEQASRANRDYTAKQRLFHLDLSGYYRYATDAVRVTAANFPFTSLLNIPQDQVFLQASKHAFDLKLGLVQPIWTGGALTNALRAEEARQSAEADQTQLLRIQVAGQVKTSYFTYRLLAAKKRSLETLLQNLKFHLSRVESFFREELARKTDLLETQAKVEETGMAIEDLSQMIAKEKINFETLCDIPPDDIDPSASETVKDYPEAWAEFQSGHPLLKALDAQESALSLAGKAVAGSRLPQVAGFGEFHFGRPGLNYFDPTWKPYALAGLSVSVPIFNLNKIDRDRAVLEVDRRRLANQRAQVLLDAERSLKQLYESRRSLGARSGSVDRLVEMAQENAGLKEKLYEESQLSNLDYLSALTDLEKYRSLKEELSLQLELVKVAVNTLIGRTGENK